MRTILIMTIGCQAAKYQLVDTSVAMCMLLAGGQDGNAYHHLLASSSTQCSCLLKSKSSSLTSASLRLYLRMARRAHLPAKVRGTQFSVACYVVRSAKKPV